jgi:hypothetical protein
VISDVSRTLDAMNPPQYVLAYVFLGGYAFSLGEFIGPRARRMAVAVTVAAALAFAALCDPWEYGVMVVAFALAGMGLFVAAAWTLWTLTSWRDAHVEQAGQVAVEEKPAPATSQQLPQPLLDVARQFG